MPVGPFFAALHGGQTYNAAVLALLHLLRDRLADARLRRAAFRYQARLRVIDALPLPEEFKRGAREQALNEIGAVLEQYLRRR